LSTASIILLADESDRRANKRTDSYGGSVENRCRFILEVVNAISDVFDGPEVVCVKINPTDFFNDSTVTFEEMQETYTHLIKKLVLRRVGIINLSRRGTDSKAGTEGFYGRDGRSEIYPLPAGYDPVLDFGRLVKYPDSPSLLMANHDYTVEEADELISKGKLDLITFGRPFICNPVWAQSLLPVVYDLTSLGLDIPHQARNSSRSERPRRHGILWTL
jgi:2,4-dienoyl-CoA reductase-like NADH-dependent reductase (Old Yellow Enzyme family)